MLCPKCDSEIVKLLNAEFVCDCAVRRLARIASPRVTEQLRRAIAFQRSEYPRCDRCDAADADGLLRCYLGCTHAQCLDCARTSNEERRRQFRWDAAKLNGLAPGPVPEQPLHPMGRADDFRELVAALDEPWPADLVEDLHGVESA